ncbi:hypothetical protein BHMPCIPO_01850 [Ensifer sesbaniae]|nr:hypothetical protein [Ensifer sesbaniae]
MTDAFVDAVRATFPLFEGELTRDMTAADVPGWDSFGHVQVMFELEDRLGVKIEPQAALICQTVGELADLVGA